MIFGRIAGATVCTRLGGKTGPFETLVRDKSMRSIEFSI
jgi:hypothetical protein